MSYIEITEGNCTIRLNADVDERRYSGYGRAHYDFADAQRAFERLRVALGEPDPAVTRKDTP